jgi:hypothetical protein
LAIPETLTALPTTNSPQDNNSVLARIENPLKKSKPRRYNIGWPGIAANIVPRHATAFKAIPFVRASLEGGIK